MDDVTFGRNGPYDDARKAEPQPTTATALWYWGRVNALWIFDIQVLWRSGVPEHPNVKKLKMMD